MLCDICFRMLRSQEGRIWKGTYDLHFTHHTNYEVFLQSANMNCGICRVLFEEVKQKLDHKIPIENKDLTIMASLSMQPHPRVSNLYRLDFKLRCDRMHSQRTFILKQTDSANPPFRTPISHNTSSDEVYQLVRHWIDKCRCAESHSFPSWYPMRLISLEDLKKRDYLDTRKLLSTAQPDSSTFDQTVVKLVETSDWEERGPGHQNARYVTRRFCLMYMFTEDVEVLTLLHISHCWGENPSNQIRLTSERVEEFKSGIKLGDLPQTFRDAIEFAARLPRVGYIWIDSLCIKQGLKERDDWLLQSASMDKVYSKTFLNISATASKNSDGGLFVPRRPELLIEDEVILNIEGIPGLPSRSLVGQVDKGSTVLPGPQSLSIKWYESYWLSSHLLLLLFRMHTLLGILLGIEPKGTHESADMNHASSKNPTKEQDATSTADVESTNNVRVSNHGEFSERHLDNDRKYLRRCTILDASSWTNRIDQAPVNTRGWVLQERLMAPRVLHFCHDQVAWECAEGEEAESQPQGMPNLQLTKDGTIEEIRLKGLDPEIDGSRLRRIKLKGYYDPDPHLRPTIYALELWRQIVEAYSRTAITQPEDKLIALSGMASLMAQKIGTPGQPAEYVAGLWRVHLASQLLWWSESIFNKTDGTFEHYSRRPKDYRAPSFSWAAIDLEKGFGITYAEITDQDLFISIDEVDIKPKSEANEYGMITSGHIILLGKLRKATLSAKGKGRFSWRTTNRSDLDEEEHTNVYLDSFEHDHSQANLLGPDADVYIVPASKGDRTASEESKYLICLMLQLVEGHAMGNVFRRIGLTKLSPWADHVALGGEKLGDNILRSYDSDVDMPHQGYDQETGMHRICLI